MNTSLDVMRPNSSTRRTVLGAALGSCALGLLPGSGAAATASQPFNLTDPANKGLIYRKIAWSLGQDFGCWWLRGTRYAVIGAEMTPLWDMHFAALFQVKDLGPQQYEVATIALSFYTNVNTGEFMRKMVNPITGETVEIHYFPVKVSKTTHDSAGLSAIKDASGGFKEGIGDLKIEGGQVWIREDHSFMVPPGPTGKAFHGNDLTTYFAPVGVMSDPKIAMAPAGQAFSDLNDWPGWLGMGDRQGITFSRNYGQKIAKLDDLPEPLGGLLKQEHPEIYRDPIAALKA